MNKNQVKGRFEQAKGQEKELVAKPSVTKSLSKKGRIIGGKVQAGFGDVKQDIKKPS